MTYTRQNWEDDNPKTPLSAERMGNIEQGIENAHTTADSAVHAVGELANRVQAVENRATASGEVDKAAIASAVDAKLKEAAVVTQDKANELITAEVEKLVAKIPTPQGVTAEQVKEAVTNYLRDNPPAAGASEAEIKKAVADAIAPGITQAVADEVQKQVANITTAAGDTGVTTVKPATGVDITSVFQAAINNPETKVIELPAGEWQLSEPINLDKATGKVIRGQGEGTVLRAAKNTGKNAFQSTSAGTLKSLYLESFVVDMGWETGDKPAHGFQITNSDNVTFNHMKVKNSGGHGYLGQGYAKKDAATGNGCANLRFLFCEVDGAGLKQNTVQQGASGFGILIKGNSPNAQIMGCKVRGVSCGMGIGATEDAQGAPEFLMITGNNVLMAENASIAFEPIGLTQKCRRASITGNILPVSKDNGISAGEYSTITANVIGEAWNHGIAVSGVGTKVSKNIISNVGKENFTRLKDDPKDWAAIAFEDPSGCSAEGNSYFKTDPESQAKHMVKINIGAKTPKANIGGNFFIDNDDIGGAVEGEFIKNLNWNPERPDVLISAEEWRNIIAAAATNTDIDALNYWFDPLKLYVAFVTYWWYDPENEDEKWRTLFNNIDVVPWVIVNPRSGPGESKEPNFVALTKKVRTTGRPSIGYVRTTESFNPRVPRAKETILKELANHVEWYGVDGVFLDEMANGWSEQERPLVQFYQDLYKEIKAKYGRKFLVVGNPGTNTVEGMLQAADVLMTFENAPDKYLNDTQSPVMPAHYKKYPNKRFCHVLHNITSEEELRKVIAKYLTLNAMFFYPSTDTFDGNQGTESPNNNPWDDLPAAWCIAMALAVSRRNLLPGSVYSYQTGV